MLTYILMIIIGFLFLLIGANLLVKGSSNIASKFHIPEMIIGLTIVALGTSAPELIITITSAISGSSDLIIGNAIGSNLCNLLFILGIMALISPILIDKEAKKIHIPVSLLASLIILFMELTQIFSNYFYLDRLDGFILIILFLIYFSYPIIFEVKKIINLYKTHRSVKNYKFDTSKDLNNRNENNFKNINKFENSSSKKINVLSSILFIIIGVILLKYGGDFVVDYSTKIAQHFNISERVIGLTILAIGTAIPELVTSIIATIKKDTDLAVGNLVGSCVLNLLLVLGVGAIITPLSFSTEFTNNLILLCFSTFLIWLYNFIGTKNTITRFKGILLLLIFCAYMISLFI